MPRILNLNLPNNKSVFIGLSYIKGIGYSRSRIICANLDIIPEVKLVELSVDNIKSLADFIDIYYMIVNKLVRYKINNIKKLIKISSYRGFRHVKGLPLRGQRTHTNAKTSLKFKFKS
jgi:small subunit ribosomal protein S13